jgi:hypothetical protein
MQDPYRSPRARLDPLDRRSPRSSLVAVLLGGFLVDFVGTIVVSVILAVGLGTALAAQGHAEPEVVRWLDSSVYLYVVSGVGLLMTIAGGYVAGRWARAREVLHGALAGALSLVLGIPFLLLPDATNPLWLDFLLVTIQVPAATFGGWLARRRVVRSSPRS